MRVAVSGGIAAGKSTVCRQFAELGAVVIDADIVARELVAPGQPALADIAGRFGQSLIQPDGTLDRRALRARVFGDARARGQLEAILHPRIQAELQRQAMAAGTGVLVAAIPLLTPATRKSAYAWLDRVLIVECPRALQIARIAARDGSDAVLAEAMVDAQLSTAERLPMADDVLFNDGTQARLETNARRLYARYEIASKALPRPSGTPS